MLPLNKGDTKAPRKIPLLALNGVPAQPPEPPLSPYSSLTQSSRSAFSDTEPSPLSVRRIFPPAIAIPSISMPSSMESYESSVKGGNESERAGALTRMRRVCSAVVPQALFISGEAVAQNLAILCSHGITHILNCAGDVCPNYFPARFTYMTYIIQDSRLTNEIMEAVLPDAIRFMHNAIAGGGRVLVHCREGVSRSATLVAAYLMWKMGVNFHEALEIIRRAREVCNPNTGFTFTLLKFASKLQGNSAQERKLFRVAIHHPAAPFVVVLGVSHYEIIQRAWMPGGLATTLDPRFYYILRSGTSFTIWRGSKVARKAENVLSEAIDQFLEDAKALESALASEMTASCVMEGSESASFWTSLQRTESCVRELDQLNEESRLMEMGGVFSVASWQKQLKSRPGAFQPPMPGAGASPRQLMPMSCQLGDSYSSADGADRNESMNSSSALSCSNSSSSLSDNEEDDI